MVSPGFMAFVPKPLITRVSTRITNRTGTTNFMAIILVGIIWNIIPITGVDVGGISNGATHGIAFCCLSRSNGLLNVVFRTLGDITRAGRRAVD